MSPVLKVSPALIEAALDPMVDGDMELSDHGIHISLAVDSNEQNNYVAQSLSTTW